MHGTPEDSRTTRVVCTLVHLLFLGVAGWIYFGGGSELLSRLLSSDRTGPAYSPRHAVLFGFGVVLFLRMSFALFFLLKRKFGWDELGGVVFALFVYQVGFALSAFAQATELGILDAPAVLLFMFGSYLNTGSEWQRKCFKENPENKGRLYAEGLFSWARHINYFGDTLWVLGWSMLTGNLWALLVPIALTAAFLIGFIPSLSKHLATRYGDQYEDWKRNTKAFVPFVY